MTSIKDIAKMCGVSVPTVSRVINNRGRYSKETEEKVRQAIAETGYCTNLAAKSLRTNRFPNIGIVVPDITNEFFASITLAIQKVLSENAYTAVICNTNEQPAEQARQLEMFRSGQVSGVIFISGEDITDRELADDIPKVFVDRVPWNAEAKNAVTVEADNRQGGYLATCALLDAGCRRIAALFDGRGLTTQVARYSGYLKAHTDRGVEVCRELYRPVTQVTFQEGYEATKQMLADGAVFDGIFCYSDLLACGALKALSEAGIAVPGQVKVAGFDGISISEIYTPSITTVIQPVEEMGRKAAELILAMVRGEETRERKYLLPVRLAERESTKMTTK